MVDYTLNPKDAENHKIHDNSRLSGDFYGNGHFFLVFVFLFICVELTNITINFA
jgi:hypothetical protein